jgi:hypothetical protein
MATPNSGSPEQDPNTPPGTNPGASAIAEAEAVLAQQASHIVVAYHRWRRNQRAMYSLGILHALGKGWVTIGEDGLIHFGSVTLDQFEKLVRIFEGLEGGVSTPAPRPGPGQIAFDFDPAPPSLPSLRGTDTLHAGASR